MVGVQAPLKLWWGSIACRKRAAGNWSDVPKWVSPDGLKFFAFDDEILFSFLQPPSPPLPTFHLSWQSVGRGSRAVTVLLAARSAPGCDFRQRNRNSVSQLSHHGRHVLGRPAWDGGLHRWPHWHGRHGQDVRPEAERRWMEVIDTLPRSTNWQKGLLHPPLLVSTHSFSSSAAAPFPSPL